MSRYACTSKHRAFMVENFLTNGESITATLRNFRNHFQLPFAKQ